jgi:hypothetical protein
LSRKGIPFYGSCKKEFLEKYPRKKGIWKGIPFFLQELESSSPGFLELESQKKGMQKGMHNLDANNIIK